MSPPPTPVVALGDDFYLDGWSAKDAAAHRRFAVDPDAARFFGWSVGDATAAPDAHYDAVIERFQREWEQGTRYSLAIRRRADGEAVGAVELRRAGNENEVSFLVAPDVRGRGLAPRALQALLAWAATELALRRVELVCHLENVASRRVAEKCGFALIDRNGDELRFRRELP